RCIKIHFTFAKTKNYPRAWPWMCPWVSRPSTLGDSNSSTNEEHNEVVWKARDYDEKPLGDGALESLGEEAFLLFS
ncbi:hypothetical protein E2562_020060, partial [Oryza meyeriana var. granulata]